VSVRLCKKSAVPCLKWDVSHKTPSAFTTVGIISSTYSSTKCCVFTVTSTLTYIVIPTAPVRLMAHSVYLSGLILDRVVPSAKK